MSLESSITANILKYLNGLPYTTAEKVMGTSSNSGKADINGCCRGRSFRIEVKTPDHKNKASRKQEINLLRWRKAGAITMVTYSLDFVTRVFQIEGIRLKPSEAAFVQPEDEGCSSWVIIPKEV